MKTSEPLLLLAQWGARLLVSAAGAVAMALAVAAWEAHAMAAGGEAEGLSFGARLVADLGVLAPLAMVVGLLAGAFAVAVDPSEARGPIAYLRALRKLEGERAAAAAMAPVALVVFVLVLAHAGRRALARGAPVESGVELAVVGLSAAGALFLVVAALAVPLARGIRAAAAHASIAGDPRALCGASAALAAGIVALGVAIGNTGGEGATPLAILGVLARKELDLRPVFALLVLAAGAWLAPVVLRRITAPRLALAVIVLALAMHLASREARALNDARYTARMVEQHAPLGGLALAALRRATDRDRDGASPLFAGGDCNDANPSIGPNMIDVPGNGVDEDCSGNDLALYVPPPDPPTVSVEDLAKAPLVDREMNLLFITIDTLRIDVGFLGFQHPQSPTPNLDKLAEKSAVYERMYAMASYTGKSLAPLFIGKYPGETLRDGAHFNAYAEGNTFLAERLKAAGMRTMGCASFWYFQPRYGMAQGIDDWDMSALPYDYNADTDTSTTSESLTNVAIELLRENDGKRFFTWVHYFDPHAQYMPHDDAPNFWGGDSKPGEGPYLGEVWFTDKHVGRLLDYVESQPWGKDTIIVVTGDHGEAFGEHDLMWHGSDLWEPIVRTPLLLYVPGVPPRRVPVKRSHVDVVPTLLDLLRVPQPSAGELSGVSMIADLRHEEGEAWEERDIFLEMPPGPILPMRRAYIHGTSPGYKLLLHGAGYEQLIDLANDPDEFKDLSYKKDLYDEVYGAYERKLGSLKEIWVPPDPPEEKDKPPPIRDASDDEGAAPAPTSRDASDAR